MIRTLLLIVACIVALYALKKFAAILWRDPLNRKKLQRFKSIKRGYWSFLFFIALLLMSVFGELFVNSRALLVRYEGKFHFPTYADMIPGKEFGLGYDYETNYRELAARIADKVNDPDEATGDFVLMPPVPYNAFETEERDDVYPPFAPSLADKHYLGTDSVGRDIGARLFYGFRIAISFALVLLACTYVVGIALGCIMGYFGGLFDLLFQRIIEIWSAIPFLYVVIIVAAVFPPSFPILVSIVVLFGWMGMTWYMRTATYKEATREYVLAARALGASRTRIIFSHILPNTVSIIVTFIPFAISSGIVTLTSLDYLGYGLPPPTPSWGELIDQGMNHLDDKWIIASVLAAMIIVLTTVTFIGEAVREAFDPKQHTTYQ
jgi:microcin C transport system permease protein